MKLSSISMKLRLAILTVLIFCISSNWFFSNAQQAKTIPKSNQFITGVSMAELSRNVLPGFEKISHMYMNPSTKIAAEIRLSVYPSVKQAQEYALFYLNRMQAVLNSGTQSGIKIGDSSWHRGSGILFTRNNVFVDCLVYKLVYKVDESYIEEIAAAIDHALVSGTAGVKLDSTPPPSLIKSIEIPDKMRVGEITTIRVHPNMVEGRQLRYNFYTVIMGGPQFGDFNPRNMDNGELEYQAKKIGKEKIVIYVYEPRSETSSCLAAREIREIEIVP
jgi:hypothetical protein